MYALVGEIGGGVIKPIVKSIEFAEHFAKMDKATRKLTLCFASVFDECGNKSINSHTISQTNLRLLAESGHLLSFKMPDLRKAVYSGDGSKWRVELNKIGLKATSSFPGFCSEHDTNLFKRIDNPALEITGQTCELLVIRTFVHEAYKKICAQYKLGSFQHKNFLIESNRAQNVQSFQLGSADLMVQAKKLYENMQLKKPSLKYLNVKYSEVLPFCYIAPINFEIKPSFGGKDPAARVLYDSCLIGLIPTSSGSSFVLAYPKSQVKNVKLFLKRLGSDRSVLPAKLLQLALESCENLFFKPTWVESLTKEHRELLSKIFIRDLGGADVLSRNLIPEKMIRYTGDISVSSNTLSTRVWRSALR